MTAPALWPVDFCRTARAAWWPLSPVGDPKGVAFFSGGSAARKMTGENVATGAGPVCACCGKEIPPRTAALWVVRDELNLYTPQRRYLHLADCAPGRVS